MYKTFGFTESPVFGRLVEVEFSVPFNGETYAYLLGNFNAFNEGSFRMEERGGRWRVRLQIPEGLWRYAFSLGGEFSLDPENMETELYRRRSYKFERRVNVARVTGDEEVYHSPSLLYLYTFSGTTRVLLRAKRNFLELAYLEFNGETLPMKKKAEDELFEFYELTLNSSVGEMEYSFLVTKSDGSDVELGPFVATPKKLDFPEWVLDRIFYQIMPDRFAHSSPSQWNEGPSPLPEEFYGGDLWGLIDRVDHITNLGVNALYLTPLFRSMTYHRYDVVDYWHVDEKLGGDEAFNVLVEELKKRNVKLVLDGVFHHTSFFHPYFQDVVLKVNKSEFRNFYRVFEFPVVEETFLEVLNSELPWKEKYLWLKEMGWNYESFFRVWLMPRLNHDNPAVRKFIREVMGYWLRSVDGWRLDVAHGVPPELWKEVRKALPREAYLVGEVMDDGRLWLFNVFHGVMNYRLYDAIIRFFVREEMDAEEFLNELQLLSAYYGPAEYLTYNFLDNHDTERFLDLVGGNKRRYLCALAFLMTYRGIPAIFYGDEIGLRGQGKGMSAGRTPMVWDEGRWDMEIFEVTKVLVSLRRSSKALQSGDFIPIEFRDKTIRFLRKLGDEAVEVWIDCERDEFEVTTFSTKKRKIYISPSMILQ